MSAPSAAKWLSIHESMIGEWSWRFPRLEVIIVSSSAKAGLELQMGWLRVEFSARARTDTIRRLSS